MNNILRIDEVVSITGRAAVVHARVYEGSINVGQQLSSCGNEISVKVVAIETYRKHVVELRSGWTGKFHLEIEHGILTKDVFLGSQNKRD